MLETVSQTTWVGAILTGFAGYAATNLDNVAVICAVVAGVGNAARRCAVALLSAAAILGIVAWVGAEIADELPLASLRWLGLVPISLGSVALVQMVRHRAGENPTARSVSGLAALVLVVLSNSADTLAVFLPLLAESADGIRAAYLGGGWVAAVTFAALLGKVMSSASLQEQLGKIGPWFAPLAMIAAGFYVILDTPTDLV